MQPPPKPDVIPADQVLIAMMEAQNNAIEACARLAEDWPGSPPNLAAAIRTLRRSETLLSAPTVVHNIDVMYYGLSED